MKLYEIAEQFKGLNALVENGDLTQDEIADTLEALEGEFKDKIKACVMVRTELVNAANNALEEANRLCKIADTANARAESLTDYIKANMIESGQDKLDLGNWSLTLRKPMKKLGAYDESKLDKKYFVTVPASQKVNKKLLLSDAKLNLVDIELVDSERSLTVK